MGIDEVISINYLSKRWFDHFESLSRLVDPGLSKGPLVAKGSGHFIPLQRPDMVAVELN
jgi:hypothetical protein